MFSYSVFLAIIYNCVCSAVYVLLLNFMHYNSSYEKNTRLADDALLLNLPPPCRNCADTFFVVCLFVSSYSQGVEYWIKSDPCLPSKLLEYIKI